MQGLHHVVLCLDRRIRTSTCDRSWICLSMHGFGRLDEFWALNIHSLWIEYSWKNRDPIWTNTHKPEGWLVNSLNCFQCGGLELAQIFGWSLTHHKFSDLSLFSCAKRPLPRLSSFCWGMNLKAIHPKWRDILGGDTPWKGYPPGN